MRCPKCGESFPVEKPGGGAAPLPPRPGTANLPRRAAGTAIGGTMASGQGLAPRGRTASGRRLPSVGAPTPPPMKRPIFASEDQTPGVPDEMSVDGLLQAASGGGVPAPADDFGDDGFGALDLGIPGAGGGPGVADLPATSDNADLPMPAAGGDLPVPAQQRAHVGGHRPIVPQGTLTGTGAAHARNVTLPGSGGGRPAPPPRTAPAHAPRVDADLPMVAQHGDLPTPAGMPPHLEPDLPLPAGADLPMVAGHADLPMHVGHADLPMPVGHADLPMAAGHADLPIVTGHADLPVPAHADLPALAEHGDLPLPFDADLPIAADADLPLPAPHGDLPIPADQDLPLPSATGDLPLPAGHDLPLPAPPGDLPLPQDFNLPTAIGAGGDDIIPMDQQIGHMPADDHDYLDSMADESGGEFTPDLASVPPRPVMPPKREGGSVGDEFAIDQVEESPDLLDGDEVAQPGEDGAAPRVKVKKKKSNAVRVIAVTIPLLAVAGGLLNYTSLGPFGAHAISDALNADSNAQQLASFRQASQDSFGTDTSAEAQTLLARARSEQQQMPRFVPMTAYASYIAFMANVRFGRDLEAMATGRQLIDSLPPEASGDELALAKAAHAAAEGQLNAASSQLSSLAQRLQGDIDVLVLAGEVALLGKNYKEALGHWTKASGIKKSARTLYGTARAQFALGKDEDARKNADAVLKLSKDHAGARALIAELLWRDDKKSVEALALLQQITKKGPVQGAASTYELVTAHSLLGDIQLSQSKLTAAEKSFSAALKIDPKSERALVGNGELFFKAGRNSEAKSRFKSAIGINPNNEDAIIGLAKANIASEKPKEAKEALQKLVKTSKNPLVGYWLGQAHEAQGNKEGAEKVYRAAIKTGTASATGAHPEVVHAFVALATLLNARGDEEEAQSILAEASEKLPNSARLHNAKGDVALRGGRLEDAKSEFQAALALETDNSSSRFNLAIAHRRLREFDAAKRELDKVAAEDPEYPGIALERGLLFQETGDTEKALEMYNDALKKAPEDIDLKLRVGSTQVISGQPRQAIPLLREVLAKRPTSAEVNHFLGRAMLIAGDPPVEALRYLQTAVRHDDNRAEYHLYEAWAANKSGQPTVAEAAIEKALSLDKNLGDAYWQRGVLLQKKGQTVDALKQLDKALELNPSRFEAYATIARCQADQTNYTEAEAAWRKAIDGNPNVPEWRYRLGKILMDRDNHGDAAPHLAAAVDQTTAAKETPGWLWNANWLLGEAVRASDPPRAVKAYKEFLRLTPSDNAYREDAKRAIESIEPDL